MIYLSNITKHFCNSHCCPYCIICHFFFAIASTIKYQKLPSWLLKGGKLVAKYLAS